MTDNRKHRRRIVKDSRQERKNGSLRNYSLNNFSGNKGAVKEEQHNTDVILSIRKDQENDISKFEIPAKDTLLFFLKLPGLIQVIKKYKMIFLGI